MEDMETLEEKRAQLIEDIKNMKNGSFEEMSLVTFYSLSSYFKSLLTFGMGSQVTRDNLNVIKEMFRILKKERKLLNYILHNLDHFDVVAAQDVVEMLDELNDKSVTYYYDVIGDIEDAVDMKEERRGIRPKKSFPTLIQSDTYTNEVVALALSKQDIRKFLGYEEEFWQHIEIDDKASLKARYDNAANLAYATAILNSDGTVNRVKMYIPEIADLNSALLAIKTYQKAYSIYKSIGKIYDSSKQVSADKEIERFQEEYLPGQTPAKLAKKI